MAVIVNVAHGDFVLPVPEDAELPVVAGAEQIWQKQGIPGAIDLMGCHGHGQKVLFLIASLAQRHLSSSFALGVVLEKTGRLSGVSLGQ